MSDKFARIEAFRRPVVDGCWICSCWKSGRRKDGSCWEEVNWDGEGRCWRCESNDILGGIFAGGTSMVSKFFSDAQLARSWIFFDVDGQSLDLGFVGTEEF